MSDNPMTATPRLERLPVAGGELLPCPFCGRHGRILPPNAVGVVRITCDACQAFAPPEAWNTRAALSEAREPDPRLAEWGYSTLDEALTHLGTLLEDQAAFDGLAAADLQKMQIGEETEQRTTAETGG